jgi:hypothetical protein
MLGISLKNVYVSIKGRYNVFNNSFYHGMTKKYRIESNYWFSVSKSSPTVQSNSISIDATTLPKDIYFAIYEEIKRSIDPNYGTSQQILIFTDDVDYDNSAITENPNPTPIPMQNV